LRWHGRCGASVSRAQVHMPLVSATSRVHTNSCPPGSRPAKRHHPTVRAQELLLGGMAVNMATGDPRLMLTTLEFNRRYASCVGATELSPAAHRVLLHAHGHLDSLTAEVRYPRPHKGWLIQTAGRWSWKSKPAKACDTLTTHLPNQRAPKVDGAEARDLY
jgi:hypothetical protein